MANEKVPLVHKADRVSGERGIDLHVLYAAVLPSFFVRTRTDLVAFGDPTKIDLSIGATIFR
ncbi:hypothetical protein AB9M62_36130 [Bacillales bacterium AN1005]